MKLNKKRVVAFISAVFIVIIFICIVFVFQQSRPYDKNNKEEIVVDIPMGATVDDIAEILKENKLIRSELIFKLNFKIKNNYAQMKSGKYLLNQTYSNADIINILVSGNIFRDGIKMTIPEGLTSKETIALLIEKNLGDKEEYEELVNTPSKFYDEFEFLNAEDIKSLEGFLYPSTYYFDENSSSESIIREMLKQFDLNYKDEFKKQQDNLNLTLQEVVNLASIVEKEAILDEDRPIIAGVFYNRLDIDMPLQSDATIQYIFEDRKKSMTYEDLKIDSPYNSYVVAGLPPTPIANPGIKSIKAVLYPQETEYLYFVADVNGGNVYSKTYEEHVKNVHEYRKDRDERNKLLEEASNEGSSKE